MSRCRGALLVLTALLVTACGSEDEDGRPSRPPAGPRPSILLVTLDTTRFDSIGPDSAGVETPAFNALVSRGRRFLQAYATVPETLPSHASMMTGLYPAGHGVHENARFLAATHPVIAERLKGSGYRTAAFVSAFVLARRFGLARGFDIYDDELPAGVAERGAQATTDRALAYLSQATGSAPLLIWVHYFDPHTPYAPQGAFATRYRASPYLGEIAAMDQQLGRLVDGFEAAAARIGTPSAMIVAGDHGEGLGDHGEPQHGHLLYQSTMRVPLVMVGPGLAAGSATGAVSVRRIFHTTLDWAGIDTAGSLRGDPREVVLGEAMKPYLNYGWQPQIMAIEGDLKTIFAGRNESYDLRADPRELKDLGSGVSLPPALRTSLDDYPVPVPGAASAAEALSDEARRSLASLGYVSGTATPVVRKDAPRPVDMVALLETIERASGLFVREAWAEAIPLFRTILTRDPQNLDAALRLATAYSMLRRNTEALETFRRAAAIAPKSDDVRLYLALHYTRTSDWREAEPILERIVRDTPGRVAAVEGLSVVRERQNRLVEAVQLRQTAYALRAATAAELESLGEMAMAAEQTGSAIDAFERARLLLGARFRHDLELGVLYLSERRLTEARDALDRVPPTHPAYPMALFKRAQVSVLLNEADAPARIARARQQADAATRPLIARETLFQGR